MRRFPGALLDIAYALPEGVLTNATLRAAHPDWKVERTARRTGVLERRIAAPEQTAYDLALPAVEALLARHPGLHDAIDGILFCTQSPDYVMPSNAFLLQRDLGFNKNILALDFNLACSGYVYGLLMASSFISTGVARNILLVTADTYSKYLAEDDRSTRMLFGDGAAATWVGDPAVCATRPLLRHFDDFQCGSDGSGWDKFSEKYYHMAWSRLYFEAKYVSPSSATVLGLKQVLRFGPKAVLYALMLNRRKATRDWARFRGSLAYLRAIPASKTTKRARPEISS